MLNGMVFFTKSFGAFGLALHARSRNVVVVPE